MWRVSESGEDSILTAAAERSRSVSPASPTMFNRGSIIGSDSAMVQWTVASSSSSSSVSGAAASQVAVIIIEEEDRIDAGP